MILDISAAGRVGFPQQGAGNGLRLENPLTAFFSFPDFRDGSEWLTAFCHGNREFSIAEKLTAQAIPVFLPTRLERREYLRREKGRQDSIQRKTVEVPLFPTYLFFAAPFTDASPITAARMTGYVVSVIREPNQQRLIGYLELLAKADKLNAPSRFTDGCPVKWHAGRFAASRES